MSLSLSVLFLSCNCRFSEGLVTFDSYESIAKILAYDGADIHGKACHICFYPQQSGISSIVKLNNNKNNNNNNQNSKKKMTMKTLKTAQDVDLVADEDIKEVEEDFERPSKRNGSLPSKKLLSHIQPKIQQEKHRHPHQHNGKPQKYIKSQ